MRSKGKTTKPGFVNRNGQEVIRPTRKRGTNHLQYIYVLLCRHCGREYGVNGSISTRSSSLIGCHAHFHNSVTWRGRAEPTRMRSGSTSAIE